MGKMWGIASTLLCLVVAGCGATSKLADDAKQVEAFESAKDAYVYAYPLMTMEMTRRVSTNFVKPEGTFAPMGQFAKLREYPNASFNAVTAPNADTLYTMRGWTYQGTVRGQCSRRERTVLSIPDARRVDDGVPGSRQTHDRHRPAEICDHRTWLERDASDRRDRVQVSDWDRVDPWPNLLHRHTEGLQGRA